MSISNIKVQKSTNEFHQNNKRESRTDSLPQFVLEVSLTVSKTSFWGPTKRLEPPPSGPTLSTSRCPATPWSAGSSAICCTKSWGTGTEMSVQDLHLLVSVLDQQVTMRCNRHCFWLVHRVLWIRTDTAARSETWVSYGWVPGNLENRGIMNYRGSKFSYLDGPDLFWCLCWLHRTKVEWKSHFYENVLKKSIFCFMYFFCEVHSFIMMMMIYKWTWLFNGCHDNRVGGSQP